MRKNGIRLWMAALAWCAGGIGAWADVPAIWLHPASVSVCPGETASFGVTLFSGSGQYQWYRDGLPLTGSVSDVYSLPDIVEEDDGATFRVHVTNTDGTTTSQVAVLTVRRQNTGSFIPSFFTNSLNRILALEEAGSLRGAYSGPRFSPFPGFEDGGVILRGSADSVSFASDRRLSAGKGRLSFQFKPDWDGATDPAIRYFFQCGALRVFKYRGATRSYFVFRYDDGVSQREISSSVDEPVGIESWLAGTWHDVVVEWDLTQPAGQQFLRFTLDGSYSKTNSSLTWSATPKRPTTFTLGSTDAAAYPAGGLMRNLSISSEPGVPAPNVWQAPLESRDSVTLAGGTVSDAVTFERGEIGNGAAVRASGQLHFPNTGQVQARKGTLSFRFKPDWDGATDMTDRYFFQSGALRVSKYVNTAQRFPYFVFRYDDNATSNAAREVSTSSLEPDGIQSWRSNEWHTIEVFWNLEGARQFIGFSIDGRVTKISEQTWTNVFPVASEMALGCASNNASPAYGVMDELAIFDECLWDIDHPVETYVDLTRDNGLWDPHETVHTSGDAIPLSDSVAPGEPYLFYQKAPFERVFEGTVPEAPEIADAFDYRMARDEYSTLFLNLYSRQGLTNATVELQQAFTNGAHTLSDVELRVVKNWWQAGTIQLKSMLPHYVPELLLSDDVNGDAALLSDLDAIIARNWKAGDYPSFPLLSYVRTSMENDTSKQLALLVKTEADTPPGVYTGVLALKNAQGGALKTVTVSIEVMPFTLAPPEKIYSTYHPAYLTSELSSALALTTNQYRAQVRDLARHGINGLIMYDVGVNYLNALNTKLTILREEGITGQIVFLGSKTQEARDALVNHGYEPYFYGLDEPNSDAKIVTQIVYSVQIQNIGGKVCTAITKDYADKLDDPNDPIYSLPGVPPGAYTPLDSANLSTGGTSPAYFADLISGAKSPAANKLETYYWQCLQELSSVNRFQAGYFLWNTGLEGVCPYVYQHISGNPYNDFDLWSAMPTYRDHLLTYPSQEGPVGTLQQKSYLEGIKDVRYLQTWTACYHQVQALDPVVAANSKAVVDAILDRYKNFKDLTTIPPSQFAADRESLQTEILSLSTVLASSGPASLTWANGSGGRFSDAANWEPPQMPLSWDTLYFTNTFTSPFVVTLDRDATAYQIQARQGSFDGTLDLQGHRLTLTLDSGLSEQEGFQMARSSGDVQRMTWMSSLPAAEIFVNRIRLGQVGETAHLTLAGPNLSVSFVGTSGDNIFLGQGTGTVWMSQGVKVFTDRAIVFGSGGLTASPLAIWTVCDPGTVVTNTKATYIGKTGVERPTLIVSNQAAYYGAGSLFVGQGGDATNSYHIHANGRLVVTGSNTLMQVLYAYLGQRAGNGAGTAGGWLEVMDGGTFRTTDRLWLGEGNAQPFGTNLYAYGDVQVRDPGSKVESLGGIYVGTAGTGRLRVEAGGAVSIPAQDLWVGRGVVGTTINANAFGSVILSGTGSVITVRSGWIGETGFGDVLVEDQARLSATNQGSVGEIKISGRSALTLRDGFVETRTLTVQSNATLRIHLGSRAQSRPYIELSGALTLMAGASLELGALDSAGIASGDTVRLIGYASRSGTFSGLPDGASVQIGSYSATLHYGATFMSVAVGARIPSITVPPQSVTVLSSQMAQFDVTVLGDAPLFYQWYREDSPIGNATSSVYRISAVTPGDHGAAFHVVVTNAGGSATSASASLTVQSGPISQLETDPLATGLQFRFWARTNCLYDVQYKDDLMSLEDWLILTNGIPGLDADILITDPYEGPSRFYRIRERMP